MHIHSHVNVSKMFQHYSLVNNNGFAAVWHPFGAVVVEVVVWEIFFFQTIPNNLSLAKLEKIGIVNKKFSTETKNINFKLYTAGKKIKKLKVLTFLVTPLLLVRVVLLILYKTFCWHTFFWEYRYWYAFCKKF